MDDVVLLAEKKSRVWEFAEKIRDYVCQNKEMKIPLCEVEIKKFRNGELGVYIPENMRKRHVFFVQDSSKDPSDWWVELLLVRDLLLSSSAESLTFVLPNMLYSRQDRKDKPHVPISARAVSRSISGGIKRIITMDLHAGQIQGFYPENVPVDNLYSFPEFVRYLRKVHFEDLNNLVVVAPDAGAAGRTKAFLGKLEKAQEDSPLKQEYSFALLSKERSKPGEVGSMQLIGDVKGKNCLIVDDIIDSGGTLCSAAKLLKSQGAEKLMCYGTHGIFTNGTMELKQNFDVVMTSNTYPQDENGVEVIDVTPLFAEAIFRAHAGLSISRLFE